MNNQQQQLWTRIKTFYLDKPGTNFTFSQRLAKENNWSIEYTNRVIEEYRKFVFLAVVAGHIVTPSEQIDQVWHLHLTYTRDYWNEFCPNVLGKPLHHQPTGGGHSETLKYYDLYSKTLASYTKFFSSQAPQDIWSSPDVRFSEDLSFKRINTQENWIIPKPNIEPVVKSIVDNLATKVNQTTTVIISAFLIILLTLGIALPGLAQNDSFYWDFLNVNLDVQDNGDLLVTESQKYVFVGDHSPERYRFIKLDHIDAIKDVQVFEDNQLLPIETSNQGDKFRIKWQDNLGNKDIQTFVLKYRALGAVTNSYGTDKLYWKAIFPNREGIINNSEILINFPKSLAGKIKDYYIFGGNFQGDLVDDTTIKFNSLQSLKPKQSTIVKVFFSSNKKTDHAASGNISSNLFLGLIVIFFVGFLILLVFMISRSNNSGGGSGGGCNSLYDSGCGGGGCGSGCGGGCGGGG